MSEKGYFWGDICRILQFGYTPKIVSEQENQAGCLLFCHEKLEMFDLNI